MSARIFLNYRRSDEPAFARLIYERLKNQFGEDNIFIDVDALGATSDFTSRLQSEIENCEVLLVIMGANWLKASDASGLRLGRPDDFVTMEIALALRLAKCVMPIIVNGAKFPAAHELPQTLRELSKCNYFRLDHDRFEGDVIRILDAVSRQIEWQNSGPRHSNDGGSTWSLLKGNWPIAAVFGLLIFTAAAVAYLGRGSVKHQDPGQKISSSGTLTAVAGPSNSPALISFVESQTHAIDGYAFKQEVNLPAGFEPGRVFPAGAKVRLALQASKPTNIVQIDKIGLPVKRYELNPREAFIYKADPGQQPMFGTAKPHVFKVTLIDTNVADVYYLSEAGSAVKVSLQNILPKKQMPIIVLDAQAGLQEAFDLDLAPTKAGLFEIRFKAHATSEGQEYDLETKPIYIVRV